MQDILLPDDFIARATFMHGSSGKQWTTHVNDIMKQCAKAWRLNLISSQPSTFHVIVTATDEAGEPVILKLGIPGQAMEHERKALQYFDGSGVCRLIRYHPESGALLLERLLPGLSLDTVGDEDKALKLASEVIESISRNQHSSPHNFQTLAQWFDALSQYRDQEHQFHTIPDKWLTHAMNCWTTLVSSTSKTYVLHGDLHHGNMLSAGTTWKSIDPKGVIGDLAYEVTPFVTNHLPAGEFDTLIHHRVRMFSRFLKLDLKRIYDWAFCHTILGWCWDIEDGTFTPRRKELAAFFFDASIAMK